MKVTIENNEIVVRLPISKRNSRSGKTTVIASTGGNRPSDVKIDGQTVYVGMNAYVHKN